MIFIIKSFHKLGLHKSQVSLFRSPYHVVNPEDLLQSLYEAVHQPRGLGDELVTAQGLPGANMTVLLSAAVDRLDDDGGYARSRIYRAVHDLENAILEEKLNLPLDFCTL